MLRLYVNHELINVRVIIDNDIAVHKILTELPSRFEIFVKIIFNEPRMPTLDNLEASHLEESNLKLWSGHSFEETLAMHFRHMIRQGSQRKSFVYHASVIVASWGRPNCKPFRGPNNPQGDDIFCFRCNQQGYICVVPSSVVQLFGAHTEEMMLDTNEESFQTALQTLSLEYEDNNWIIDSEASHHFSRNAHVFVILEPSYWSGTTVSATNSNHVIYGQRSVNVPSSFGDIKNISFVSYVPDLNRNLFSIGNFTKMVCMVVSMKNNSWC